MSSFIHLLARPRRLERLTSTFGGLRSIQTELRAHGFCIGAQEGIRTPMELPTRP